MTDAILLQPEISPKVEARRAAILDAAVAVFMRRGFEVATMQDVATACGMSVGNIYRYFTSKSAIISDLVERDRTQMAAQFAELAKQPDQLEGFERMGRCFIREEITRKAGLTLEIWAAASRNEELRGLCSSMDAAVTANMSAFISRATAQGDVVPGVDASLVTHLVISLVQSMFRDAKLNPSHDLERDLDIMFATVRAALAGHIRIPSNQNQQTHVSRGNRQ
jgi:TetR/AcrR family transcriptional regulator, repressor for uid operon